MVYIRVWHCPRQGRGLSRGSLFVEHERSIHLKTFSFLFDLLKGSNKLNFSKPGLSPCFLTQHKTVSLTSCLTLKTANFQDLDWVAHTALHMTSWAWLDYIKGLVPVQKFTQPLRYSSSCFHFGYLYCPFRCSWTRSLTISLWPNFLPQWSIITSFK